MIDYLTHYDIRDTPPFRSLSTLPDEEALTLMQALDDETMFGVRFKDPLQYLHDRRRTEQWVRTEFIMKGGQPLALYPVYMVLGSSPWLEQAALNRPKPSQLRISLANFQEGDVSFTYPDSRLSHWFGTDQPVEYYQPAYHGKIFTRTEILAIVAARGLPEEDWEPHRPDHLAPYIEAQVWNRQSLLTYQEQMASEKKCPRG